MKKILVGFALTLFMSALVSCNNHTDTIIVVGDTLETVDTITIDSIDTTCIDTIL